MAYRNGYLTPPGSQGLKYHFDPYVTLIVQVSGSKIWPVHRPFIPNPVREYGSLHLTGLAGEILAQALADPAMREAVPPAQLTDPAATVRHARDYLLGALLTLDEVAAGELLRSAALRQE